MGGRRAEIHPYELLPEQSATQRTEAADHRSQRGRRDRKSGTHGPETGLDDGGREAAAADGITKWLSLLSAKCTQAHGPGSCPAA